MGSSFRTIALASINEARWYFVAVRMAQVVPRGEQPWSGVLTVIVHLSAALARRGHQVEVWQLHRWTPEAYADQRAVLHAAGAGEVTVSPEVPLGQLGRAVEARAAERTIDLVHLHGAFNRSNTAISRSLKHPFVFSPHSGYDPVSLRRSRGRKILYRLLYERTMLERAALTVALTEAERDQIMRFGARGPVTVIPNGVAAPEEGVDRSALRRGLGLADTARLAAFVGRLDVFRKGLDILVEGIAEAPRWHAALIGPWFRDEARLERMVADLQIRDRVHFTGERHGRQLQEALAGADLFVLTSRWEGLPMALLEAMSYGTPAAVSPAVSRLIDVQAAGAGWEVGNGELGRLLRRLEEDAGEELRARGEAARELAGRYDWDAVAERYEAAYREVLRSRDSVR
jgi:glycosyltransferase involved in cell wall biosynthesis